MAEQARGYLSGIGAGAGVGDGRAAATGGPAWLAPQSGSSAGCPLPPRLSSAQVLCAPALPVLGRSSADWADAAQHACNTIQRHDDHVCIFVLVLSICFCFSSLAGCRA